MRIFGTITAANIVGPDYQEGSTRGIYGAGVARRNFYTALLRYGSFDEYHFSRPTISLKSIWMRTILCFNFYKSPIKYGLNRCMS